MCTDVASIVRRSISRSRSRTNREDVDREFRINGNETPREESEYEVHGNALELSSTYSKNIVSFAPDDPANPVNWKGVTKTLIVLVGILTVINSTMGSALPSGVAPQLAEHFDVRSQEQEVLPNSIYLVGYIPGPLLFAPLSESYGRQIIMIGTFAGFMGSTLGTCLAPNWPAFLIFRFLAGVFASSPLSVTGGIYADLYSDPVNRGRAMAMFMAATTWGPTVAPIASGYLGVYSWQWPFWFGLIFAGVTAVPLAFLPETYGPVILQRKAAKIRRTTPGTNVWAPLDLEITSMREMVTIFLGRPFRMLFFEAIVIFSCLFLSLVYAIIYIFFQAFPLIFPPTYGFSLGEQGLAFLGIGIGALFAGVIYLWWDDYLRKAKAKGKSWAGVEEYRRLPLACIGGPFFTVGLFWIGWAARPNVHWIVPILGGIPTGIGYLLLFMSLINYLVDAYKVFAASAVGAASSARALFGAVLPFAARPMYRALGIAWACSLLGFLSLAMCLIPFAFIKWGPKIRANSAFCQELETRQREKDEQDRRRKARMEEKERNKADLGTEDV